jgi:hypothetical protein
MEAAAQGRPGSRGPHVRPVVKAILETLVCGRTVSGRRGTTQLSISSGQNEPPF